MAGKRGTKSTQSLKPNESSFLGKDVEDRPPQDRKYRFRDEGRLEPDDQRRVQFKAKLLKSAEDSKFLEDYRKSDDEVSLLKAFDSTDIMLNSFQLKNIKNKTLRGFYSRQNERLGDWMEVNAIVKALSDDIIESLDPRDDNGGGIAEGGGALQDVRILFSHLWLRIASPYLPKVSQYRALLTISSSRPKAASSRFYRMKSKSEGGLPEGTQNGQST